MASTHTFSPIRWTTDLIRLPAIYKPSRQKYNISCWLIPSHYNLNCLHTYRTIFLSEKTPHIHMIILISVLSIFDASSALKAHVSHPYNKLLLTCHVNPAIHIDLQKRLFRCHEGCIFLNFFHTQYTPHTLLLLHPLLPRAQHVAQIAETINDFKLLSIHPKLSLPSSPVESPSYTYFLHMNAAFTVGCTSPHYTSLHLDIRNFCSRRLILCTTNYLSNRPKGQGNAKIINTMLYLLQLATSIQDIYILYRKRAAKPKGERCI